MTTENLKGSGLLSLLGWKLKRPNTKGRKYWNAVCVCVWMEKNQHLYNWEARVKAKQGGFCETWNHKRSQVNNFHVFKSWHNFFICSLSCLFIHTFIDYNVFLLKELSSNELGNSLSLFCKQFWIFVAWFSMFWPWILLIGIWLFVLLNHFLILFSGPRAQHFGADTDSSNEISCI
jgi:hypothetical protein